ncbi:MAG: cistern family PEP-CTERM protein [Burkholderiaceae bacterium]
MIKFKSACAVLLTALGVFSQAHATAVISFNSLNTSRSILYSTSHDGATLSATVTFTLSSWSAGQAQFATSISNSSTGPGTNRLMSFGIDVVSPTLTGASANGNWDAGINDTLPSFASVDLCIWRSNGCSGGAIGNGLGEGGIDTFVLTLLTSGDFTQGISFTSPYGMKFQDVGLSGQSFEFAGCAVGTPGCGDGGGGGSGGGITSVPEPGSLALLGVAIFAAGASRTRRGRA